MDDSEIFDVAIVGYGPVGAALAILLGQRGHRVVVLERYTEPYPLPRAVHYDHEVARILQSCGVAERCAGRSSEPHSTARAQCTSTGTKSSSSAASPSTPSSQATSSSRLCG